MTSSRQLGRTLLPLAILATGVGLGAVPAYAGVDTAAALSACNHNVGGVSAALHLEPTVGSVSVGGTGGPLEPQLRPGAVVHVRASGKVSYGGIFNWRGTWGPDGNGRTVDPRDHGFPYPGGPDAALVGTWSHLGENLKIGSDSRCVVVKDSALRLVTNDNDFTDNGDVGYYLNVTAWLYFG
ncbi:hypothetical protein [Fodinicola acaciae]|uniref:hypothetical protein n=1 Tax=Fodinicola acaciae TaxID=2681555 RepID=UPI0013D5211A|nr:hypothetical protein [Fodinicola acaciae]